MQKKNSAGNDRPYPRYPDNRHAFGNACGYTRSFCAVVTILLVFFLTIEGYCEEIPWSGKNFLHISEDQPVQSLLKDIFLSEGLLANISSSIEDTRVSGKFNKPAEQVFRQITSAFSLIWYFDGQVVNISPADEITSMTIPVKHTTIKKVKRSLNDMGIADRKYPIRYYPKERLVMVHGPKIYVKRIADALKIFDVYQKKPKKKAIQAHQKNPEKKRPRRPSGDRFAQAVQHVRIFRLKHAWAADRQLKIGDRTITIQGVATILKGLTNKEKDQSFSLGHRTVDDHPGAGVVNAGETDAKGAKLKAEQDNQSLSDVDYLPESEHTIQCAERLNAVIIQANPINMVYYEKIIAELDVPLQLIEIKASIIDVDSEALSSIGLDVKGRRNARDAVHTYHSNVIAGNDPLFEPAKIPAGNFGGLNFSTILGDLADDYFAVRIKALESKGKAKVISKPSIITFDNIEARFTNTETFYVRVAAQDDASLYEISAGVVLKVTPHIIFEDHNPRIQLMIAIEDGKIKGNVVDDIPVVENSTINTQAVVSGNESLLIGGLIYDTRKEVQRSVPLLGDIPLVGLLFRSKDKVEEKTERLFLISPRILSVDGNANVIARDGESDHHRVSHRHWPWIKLFETAF